jgi:hypothetical protein
MLLYIPLLYLQASLAPYLPTLPPSLSLLLSPLLSSPLPSLQRLEPQLHPCVRVPPGHYGAHSAPSSAEDSA